MVIGENQHRPVLRSGKSFHGGCNFGSSGLNEFGIVIFDTDPSGHSFRSSSVPGRRMSRAAVSMKDKHDG